jgi:hypothetical protein
MAVSVREKVSPVSLVRENRLGTPKYGLGCMHWHAQLLLVARCLLVRSGKGGEARILQRVRDAVVACCFEELGTRLFSCNE